MLAAGSLLLHRYRLERPLGRGGAASTWLALDLLREARVALKVLHAPAAELLSALRLEFSLLRSLHHPHLVHVYDFAPLLEEGSGSTRCFFTAEFIQGVALHQFAACAPWEAVRQSLIDTLEALRWLHARRIRHGDVKPDNILVRGDASATLLDLGCARPLPFPPGPTICGTPGFLAPELLASGTADHRADLFSFGVTLRLLINHRSDVPDCVTRILPRLVEADPALRPASVDEVLEAFDVEPAGLSTILAHPGVLIGRDDILAEARFCLDALRDLREAPRILELAGADGSGRSRTLRELKWEAQRAMRVIETDASSPAAIATMLSLAASLEVRHEGDVVSALDRLRAQGSPLVLVVDDAHRLSNAQQSLLRALARSLTPSDPVLLTVTVDEAFALDACDKLRLTLLPLTAPAVRTWVGSAWSAAGLGALVQATGGSPAALVSVLGDVDAGRLDEASLIGGRGRVEVDRGRVDDIALESAEAARVLAFLAAADRALSQGELERFGMATSVLDGLVQAGLARRNAGSWRLARAAESKSILEALPPGFAVDAHRRLSSDLLTRAGGTHVSSSERSELEARAVLHLAGSGDLQAAERAFQAHELDYRYAPGAWLRTAELLAQKSSNPRSELARASLLRRSGQARHAVPVLQALLASGRPASEQLVVRYELAASLLDAGDVASAVVELERALHVDATDTWAARCALLLARTLTRRGEYPEAALRAEAALSRAQDDLQRAEALIASGVAQSFLGHAAEASTRLSRAVALLDGVHDPRLQVRALGSLGLLAFNEGQLDGATAHYAAALQVAEEQGLSDQVATAALNLGTACHQAGRWAEARTAYERGMRMAIALGQRSTEALLRFDLAKLCTDSGQFERAEALLSRAERAATEAGTDLVHAELLTVRAELAHLQGRLEESRGQFERAGLIFEQRASLREKAEVDVQLAAVLLETGALDAAERQLSSAAATFAKGLPGDVRIRAVLVRAALLMARHQLAAALAVLEPCLRDARAGRFPDEQARVHLLMAAIWDTQGSTLLAAKHRNSAREVWEHIAALLPQSDRDAFWRHPTRVAVRAAVIAADTPPGAPRDARVDRLLDINKRLNSSLEPAEILRRAMDAAVELTGAERGFVLLADRSDKGARLRVAAARNLDREQVDRAHLKFSRAIAEQVVASGNPVTTSEARTDERFASAASVHALQLSSVVCVPVISPAGVMGALYLDNRFQRGLFAEDDVRVLQAFADQVAIALTNARLHKELAERTRELEDRNRRIEELMQSQAAQIETLQELVRSTRGDSPHRFDYRSIVGSSRAMQQVFALLDRVVDTDLPILIAGESGTGKELVARAIHANSSRSRGPLVSINCGAVPEQLLESELFGHERGAFTGADRSREGLMVQASGGTLFLDELGELPLSMQVKLLRVLQEREVRPLGSNRAVAVDFRLVCATNRRLRDELARGAFREDLFYRISTIELSLPPLRDRLEDIPELAARILERACVDTSRPIPQLTRPALQKLMTAPWPGNVRQLENVLLKSAVMCDGDRIAGKDIDLPARGTAASSSLTRTAYETIERERIARALVEHRWNVARVSRVLGIPRPTLYRKLEKYRLATGIVRDDEPPAR